MFLDYDPENKNTDGVRTGNQQIGDYMPLPRSVSDIGTGGYPIVVNTGSPTIGFSTRAFGNPNAMGNNHFEATLGLRF